MAHEAHLSPGKRARDEALGQLVQHGSLGFTEAGGVEGEMRVRVSDPAGLPDIAGDVDDAGSW